MNLERIFIPLSLNEGPQEVESTQPIDFLYYIFKIRRQRESKRGTAEDEKKKMTACGDE